MGTAASPSSDSSVSNNALAHDARTHLNNVPHSSLTRAITPSCASLNKPFFAVFPGYVGQLSCVLRAYLWRLSVINILYLHVPEACRLLFSHHSRSYYLPLNSQFFPYVSYSPYFHVIQLPTNFRSCLESVQKTHKERSSQAPARRPAQSLQIG